MTESDRKKNMRMGSKTIYYKEKDTEDLWDRLFSKSPNRLSRMLKYDAESVLWHLNNEIDRKYKDTASYLYCYCAAWKLVNTKYGTWENNVRLWHLMLIQLHYFVEDRKKIDAGT